MASKEVFRIVTAEGHEHDYHGSVAQLKEAHPGAVITGRRVMNAVGEGSYEPFSIAKAQAAERKAAEDEEPVNYQRMKVDDLKAMVDERGIIMGEGAKKADLVAALEQHDAGGGNADSTFYITEALDSRITEETDAHNAKVLDGEAAP